MRRFVAVAAVFVTIATSDAFSQATDPPRPASAPKLLTLDVISVKPNHSLDNSGMMRWLPNGIDIHNMTLHTLFMNAFEVWSSNQIVGYPEWVNSEHFDIQAKMDADTAEAWKNMRGEESNRQWHAFNRQILDERFALKAHVEKRELPVYNLVIAKQGLKLQQATPDDKGSSSMGPGKLTAHRSQVGSLAFSLAGVVGRVIIDKTSLSALYDIDLTWSPDNEPDTGPSIFSALQDQLGLKLEPAKAPLDVVVVDRIERPSEN